MSMTVRRILAGVVLALGLAWTIYVYVSWSSDEHVPATVVSVQAIGRNSSHPTVPFTSGPHQRKTVFMSTTWGPHTYVVGEHVMVYYPHGDPEDAELDTAWKPWVVPGLALIAAIILAFARRRAEAT